MSSVVVVGWALLPAFVQELIDRSLIRRHSLSLPRGGRSGPAELTALVRVAQSTLEGRCTDPKTARIRVTLFIPDQNAGLMRQLARWTWEGHGEISETTVVVGTCAAGHAWNTREAFRLTVSPELGFVKALQRCGVSEDDAKAHNLRDRQLFVSVPVFENESDQAPFTREGVPDDRAVAVLVADAAEDCLPKDWYEDLHLHVFPALVSALQHAPQSRHLFSNQSRQGQVPLLPPRRGT